MALFRICGNVGIGIFMPPGGVANEDALGVECPEFSRLIASQTPVGVVVRRVRDLIAIEHRVRERSRMLGQNTALRICRQTRRERLAQTIRISPDPPRGRSLRLAKASGGDED